MLFLTLDCINTIKILAKCKTVWMLLLNNSTTLNSNTNSSRCSQILPNRLNSKRSILRYPKMTFRFSLLLLNQWSRIQKHHKECIVLFGILKKSRYQVTPIWDWLKLYNLSPTFTWCKVNVELDSIGKSFCVIITKIGYGPEQSITICYWYHDFAMPHCEIITMSYGILSYILLYFYNLQYNIALCV